MNVALLLPYLNDALSFALSALLLILYHLFLRRKERSNPSYTVQAVNRSARSAWVEHVMREGRDILAVQTLRNSTMAATFLASTTVLLIFGVLSLGGQTDKLETTWHSLNLFGARHAGLWTVKLLFLLVDLFFAFFSFAMSIRIFNHVGYMINVPPAANHMAITPIHVAIHLNRAGRFYSFGMRAYYFAVPLLFWLFGPHLMLMATAGLVCVMYRLDRAPKIPAAESEGNLRRNR
ncbi:MAG: DUF599 domain-containing protein [Rhodocyclaceae bacterium]|nr:MAG: DUF599 domain-containing protein [Rhodocyclaceae bacterium]